MFRVLENSNSIPPPGDRWCHGGQWDHRAAGRICSWALDFERKEQSGSGANVKVQHIPLLWHMEHQSWTFIKRGMLVLWRGSDCCCWCKCLWPCIRYSNTAINWIYIGRWCLQCTNWSRLIRFQHPYFYIVIRLFSMICCIFQRSPGIKNRSLWCLTSTRLGLFGAMCLGGPTGPSPNRRIANGSVFPAETRAKVICGSFGRWLEVVGLPFLRRLGAFFFF